jgi:poly [ADP-ribose] polymerase 6/8
LTSFLIIITRADYCKDWGLPLQTLTLLDPSPSQQNNNMRRPQKHNKVLQKGELDENQNDSLLSGVSSESLRNSAEERYLENKKLIEDVENYKKFYGEDNIILKPLILLEEVEINLLMDPLGVLDYNTAEAWGVNPSLPICIKISVSDTLYVNTNIPPSLEIWQLEGETKKKFGLKAQLEMIMREFVKEHWPGKKSRPQVNSKPHPKTTTTSKGSNSPLKKKFKGKAQKPKLSEEMKPKEQQSAKWTPSSKPTNKPFQQTVDISHLAQLVNMGFDEDAAFNALTITDDLEQATNLLLENLPLSPSSTLAPKSSLVSKWSTNEPNKQSIQQKDTEVQDIFEDPSKAVLATKYKGVLVVEDHGFLVLLMSYFLGRLPTLNNYCVICDQPHVFAVGNMLKPAVCSRELCCFSFQQLGVGAVNGVCVQMRQTMLQSKRKWWIC